MTGRQAVGVAAVLALPVNEGKAKGPLTGIWNPVTNTLQALVEKHSPPSTP